MFLVRLVYSEGDNEGDAITGKVSGHRVKDSLSALIMVSVYIWLKLVTVMAKSRQQEREKSF